MHFRPDEKVVAKFRRFITPFIFKFFKMALVSLPFYGIAYFIGRTLGNKFLFVSFLVISIFLGFFIFYVGLLYFLDILIITTHRVILVDWKSLFNRIEHEAELSDIQDIKTKEYGILSQLKIFDYGLLSIETASSRTTIVFDSAPDPESIKHFLLAYIRKGAKA